MIEQRQYQAGLLSILQPRTASNKLCSHLPRRKMISDRLMSQMDVFAGNAIHFRSCVFPNRSPARANHLFLSLECHDRGTSLSFDLHHEIARTGAHSEISFGGLQANDSSFDQFAVDP